MKKKVIAVLLVLVLVAGAVSAKDGSIKVGAQLGWGFDTVFTKATGSTSLLDKSLTLDGKYKNNGFAGSLTAEYLITDSLSVRGTFGLMFTGKTETYAKLTGLDASTATLDNKAGTYIDVAIDAKYAWKLDKEISVSVLAGVEMANGYIYKSDSEDINKDLKNFAFGINVAPEFTYTFNKNLDVNVGCSVGWFFLNNAKSLKASDETVSLFGYKLLGAKTSNPQSLLIRPYVGVSYAFF